MKKLLTITLTLLISSLSHASSDTQNLNEKMNSGYSDNLIEAVSNIDMIGLNILLSDGADIDTVDQNGNTPLMIAAKIGNLRMVNLLLAHNPSLDKKNSEGNTALMIASENGQTFVVEKLIAKGADLNAKNAKGLNAHELAKRNGHAAIIDLLKKKNEMILSR